MSRVSNAIQEEFYGCHPALVLLRAFVGWLPPYMGNRLRTLAMRAAGLPIGHGTMFWGLPTITGPRRPQELLRIGSDCWINIGCLFDLGASIHIGDRVSLGHEVMVLTSSHRIGDRERRAGPVTTAPIRIQHGAWIGSRATILPGVTVGEGSIVAAGAVVTCDVPAHTLVGGVPAKTIRSLNPPAGREDRGDASRCKQ